VPSLFVCISIQPDGSSSRQMPDGAGVDPLTDRALLTGGQACPERSRGKRPPLRSSRQSMRNPLWTLPLATDGGLTPSGSCQILTLGQIRDTSHTERYSTGADRDLLFHALSILLEA
jgi:hypothetical protein